MSILRHIITLVVAIGTVSVATAQETGDSIRSHAFAVGIGSSHQLDTYLSPQNYSGLQINMVRETIRMTRMAQHRISFQSIWQGAFSHTRNASQSATDCGGRISYDALWHYNWTPARNLRLMAGGGAGADAGFLYNSRGGNNPAQARLGADISASIMAIYKFKCLGLPVNIRYQANLPLLGFMFSPQFGQSYYEIGEGHMNNNICFTHPFNAFSLWQQITADIPLGKKFVLRAGYLCDIKQSHINHIKMHDRSHSFMIGFVRHFRLIGKSERDSKALIL